MRKVVAGLFISLDGVVEAPETWHFPYFNDEMMESISASMALADSMLLGRVTYEEFAAYWPSVDPQAEPMAAYMNNTPKYVVSTTLTVADWTNSTLINGNIAEEIAGLKQQPGKNINIVGSPTLVHSLLQADLLDELGLLLHPVVVARGKRLFKDEGELKKLELAEAKTFRTGVLSLTYRPAPHEGEPA